MQVFIRILTSLFAGSKNIVFIAHKFARRRLGARAKPTIEG